MSILGDTYDEAIKGFEGFSPRASWDYKQNSVGWGTRAKAPGETIDREEAQRRYDDEIAKAHGIVKQFAPSLDPGTTAALTSLTFNAGSGWTQSGLGAAIKAGDLDKARASFLQYVNAGGQPLDGLRNRRASEVGWFGQAEPGAPAQQQQTAQAQPMASPPAQQGTARMADEQPGFLDQLAGRMQNPLTMGGLGLLLSASQGGNMAQGLQGGVQTGMAAQKQHREALRAMQQKMLLQKMAQDPNFAKAAGLPQGLMDLAVAGEDPGMVAKFIASRPDRELDRQKLQLGVDTLQQTQQEHSEMFPIKKMQAESQASLTDVQAQAARRDLATPPQQITVLPPDAKAIMSDRRTGQHQIIENGNQKLSDAERAAILESDNQIQTGQSALSTVRQIRALNKTAYDSWGAEGRANVASPFGAQGAQDTQVMKNLITSQALDQLRATFGGNPTEGERKILLDIQGSISQPRAVRERLFSRAEELVAQRLRMQEQRANGIRGGSYFKSGYQPQQQPAGALEQQSPQSGAAPSAQPRRIQNDADYDTIKPGEQYIDPNGIARTKGWR